LQEVERTFCRMIIPLSLGEKVKVLIEGAAMQRRVEGMLETHGTRMRNLQLVNIKSADVWIRDYGPTFLLSRNGKERAAIKWRFNAWGGKYDDLLYDDQTGEDIVRTAAVHTFRPGIVMEGGSIDVNGSGTVLTTEQCLLNKNRNPQLNRKEIEHYLEEYLGVSNVVWLHSGIEGDDTDGHVDDFARFVSEDEVICAHSRSRGAHNTQVLERNLEILASATNESGNPLRVRRLPMPKPLYLEEEKRWLPASYANFYVGNAAVLLPVFRDKCDATAKDMLQEAFPDREIVPIPAADLVYGYGGIHCVTQQEPAARTD